MRAWFAVSAVAVSCLLGPGGSAAQDDASSEEIPTLQVYPSQGEPRTIFHVKYDAYGAEGGGGDYLDLQAPRGTRCREAHVEQPIADAGGLTRIFVGPDVFDRLKRQGPRREPVDIREFGVKGNWCPGLWRGEISYQGDDSSDVLFRFRFRVRRP